MSILSGSTQKTTTRRTWKTPTSKANWLWLLCSALLYGGCYIWYDIALKQQQDADPASYPFLLFGMTSFSLVLLVTAYTLRRHFARWLPGKVQNWLWLHIWFGVISILIAFLHEGYSNILHDYDFSASGFTDSQGGMTALFSLIAIVLSGIIGRLLDTWQSHTISKEANRNGIGISRSLRDHLTEMELGVERLNAGKSSAFKAYFSRLRTGRPRQTALLSAIPANESRDLQQAEQLAETYLTLRSSYKRLKRAERVIQLWRYIHIPLATLGVLVIAFHSITELWMIFFPG